MCVYAKSELLCCAVLCYFLLAPMCRFLDVNQLLIGSAAYFTEALLDYAKFELFHYANK